MFTQAPPKTGMPVWGWVAVFAVAGVLAFNGLAGGSEQPDALPAPDPSVSVSESAAPEETADAATSEGAGGAVYLLDDSDFASARVVR